MNKLLSKAVIVMLLLASCTSSTNQEVNTVDKKETIKIDSTNISKTTPSTDNQTDGHFCYRFVAARDTYDISFNRKADSVYGKMIFDNFEKDASRGTINGGIQNSIIKVNYRFQSEGQTSENIIYLKQNGEELITGVGEPNAPENKIDYIGPVYHRIDCQDLHRDIR